MVFNAAVDRHVRRSDNAHFSRSMMEKSRDQRQVINASKVVGRG